MQSHDVLEKNLVDILPNYLITLGEVSLHDTHAVSARLIQLIQSIVLMPKVQGKYGFHVRESTRLTTLKEDQQPKRIFWQ